MSKELYVTAEFTLPAAAVAGARAALNALGAPTGYRTRHETFLGALREFDTYTEGVDPETGHKIYGYDGETTTAAAEDMLRGIAPFVSSGQVTSEDQGTGERRRYTFRDGLIWRQDEETRWGPAVVVGADVGGADSVVASSHTSSLLDDVTRLRALAEEVIVARQAEDTAYDDSFGELNDLLSALKDHLILMALRHPDGQGRFVAGERRAADEPLTGQFVDVVRQLDDIYDAERADQ